MSAVELSSEELRITPRYDNALYVAYPLMAGSGKEGAVAGKVNRKLYYDKAPG